MSSGLGIFPAGVAESTRVAPARLPLRARQQRLGLHEAWGERVDPDCRSERLGVGLRDAEPPVLAGGVLRGTRAAANDHGRADVDNRAASALHHPLSELMHHQHRALDVNREHGVDRLLGHLGPGGLTRCHVAYSWPIMRRRGHDQGVCLGRAVESGRNLTGAPSQPGHPRAGLGIDSVYTSIYDSIKV